MLFTNTHVSRWLSSSGVSLSSEKKQRKLAKEQVGDNFEAETAPFSFNFVSGGGGGRGTESGSTYFHSKLA